VMTRPTASKSNLTTRDQRPVTTTPPAATQSGHKAVLPISTAQAEITSATPPPAAARYVAGEVVWFPTGGPRTEAAGSCRRVLVRRRTTTPTPTRPATGTKSEAASADSTFER
jgi:hypothetical protein